MFRYTHVSHVTPEYSTPLLQSPAKVTLRGDKKLRDRVTGVAIATAIYFIASALIQVEWGERHLKTWTGRSG
jgi:hypothetical protein